MVHTATRIEQVDVLIVGAGISGIGAAYYLQKEHPGRTYAILEARARPGVRGTCSDIPGSVRTPTCTPSATSSSRGATRSDRLGADEILAYLRETAAENGLDAHIRFQPQGRGAAWSSPTRAGRSMSSVSTPASRTGADRRLDLLRRRVLPIRRGLRAPVRRARAVPRAGRAPAALARGPRLRRQAGRRHRQRGDSGDPGAGDG